MRRSLSYFWRTHLAVALGAAVTTAVLTGALLVGDSVRGSLRALTLERLGGIDSALVGQRFFREGLAAELAATDSGAWGTAPAILVRGSVRHGTNRRRATRVQIQGVNERLFDFFGGDAGVRVLRESFGGAPPGQAPVVINGSLAEELEAHVGDAILLSLERPSEVPPEYLLGSREPAATLTTVRGTVAAVIPDEGIGRFGLEPHQNLPLNVFLPLRSLQGALSQEGRSNALLVGAEGPDQTETVRDRLQDLVQLEDVGLSLRDVSEEIVLESREMLIPSSLEEAVRKAAQSLQLSVQPVFTYLANSISVGDRTLPYSTVAALDPASGEYFRLLRLVDESPAPRLAENEVLLNKWAAEDLQAEAGDSVGLTYFVVGPREQLITQTAQFLVGGIVAQRGLGADRSLTPPIKGVQEAADMSSWDPPIPIDLDRIRPQDEEYWDQYGATPKCFLSYQTGVSLWKSRFGRLTSLRLTGGDVSSVTHQDLRRKILEQADLKSLGFVLQPVKRQGLEAARGATDFGMLFIGFSFFLIISAVLLVRLLFRLGVEQRAAEIGLLLAIGFPLARVRRRFLAEGALVAAFGIGLGLVGAVAYAWLLITGLRTLWSAAIGSPFLTLHVGWLSLAAGAAISVLALVATIWASVRTLARTPPPSLLAGLLVELEDKASSRWARRIAWGGALVALVLTVAAFVSQGPPTVFFFGIGVSLLAAGIAVLSMWLRSGSRTRLQPATSVVAAQLAARNCARHPGRSLLSAGLIACASFVIVAVGANRHEPGEELLRRESGAGGFSILARSDSPLQKDLNSADALFDLGFSDADIDSLKETTVFPLRLLPGQDVSCLNLYQPEKPQLLGVPSELIERGGFQFQGLMEETDNPWTLLTKDLGEGIVPAFGDANSMMWILHVGLGDDILLLNEAGEEIRLRLLGLLSRSVFQGEVLIAEEQFLRHFPSRSGFSYFLIDTPVERISETTELLEDRLSPFGLDARLTPAVLAGYLAVENTYLSTFQTLGGLGLLLGTLGLGVVLVRNVLERQGELATLRAFGFRRLHLAQMVMAENGFLLLTGVLIGSGSALIAVSPHALASGPHFPWLSLGFTMVLVLAVGLLAGLMAVRTVLKVPLLPALKAE